MNKSEFATKITLIEPFTMLNQYELACFLEHIIFVPLTKSKPYYLPEQAVCWLPIEGILFLQKERGHRPDYCNIRLSPGMLWCTKSQHTTENLQTIYPLTDGLIGILKETSFNILLQCSENLRRAFVDSRIFALRGIQEELYQINMMPLTNRLVRLLLELNQWYCKDGHRLPYTQKELAQVLGAYRETISLLLQPLRKKGWIQIRHGSIRLTNIPMLRRLT